MANDGENAEPCDETCETVANGYNEGVSGDDKKQELCDLLAIRRWDNRVRDKRLPIDIAMEFAVTGKTHESTQTNTEGEEDLASSIYPHLDVQNTNWLTEIQFWGPHYCSASPWQSWVCSSLEWCRIQYPALIHPEALLWPKGSRWWHMETLLWSTPPENPGKILQSVYWV